MPADRLREPVRYLVFSASLRRGSLNTKLADLASTHYPCVKRAWVEYLGEHPEPALDRVE